MSKKRQPIAILIIATATLAGAVGYFAYVHFQKITQEPLSLSHSEKGHFTQDTQASKMNDFGWEVYRNDVYSIEFQYPRGWFFKTTFDARISFEQNQDQSSLSSQISNYSLASLPVKKNFYVTPKDFFQSVLVSLIDDLQRKKITTSLQLKR